MSVPIPHPTSTAVNAAAAAGFASAQAARGIHPLEQLRYAELSPMEKHQARSIALTILTPATPFIATTTARAIAAMLDQAGEHAAARKVHELVGEWDQAAQDPFGQGL